MNRSARCNLFLVAALTLALGLSGCVANRAYREPKPVLRECASDVYQPTYSRDSKCTAQDRLKYSLAFVEFDDVGEMFRNPSEITAGHDNTELGKTLTEIDEINKYPGDPGPVFVVFIHGWHNNASEASGNVWGFRSELRQLAAELNPRPVMGIYIGWRGEATTLPLVKNLSFWNRKNTAARIPGAHLTEAIRRITIAAKKNSRARCVVVGHSFGGLVLERTLTQAMVEMVVEYRAENERIEQALLDGKIDERLAAQERANAEYRLQSRRPDLTVLLNEAGPATEAKQFLTFLNDEGTKFQEPGSPDRFPLFLSLTSTGDSATHILFPVGQFLGKRGLNTRTYDEKDEFGETKQNNYFLHTAANSASLVNHSVTPEDSTQSKCREKPYRKFALGTKTYYICNDDSPEDSIKRTTPYWIMQIPTVFVPDHSTVFKPELRVLLKEFIGPLTGTPYSEAGEKPVARKPVITLSPKNLAKPSTPPNQ